MDSEHTMDSVTAEEAATLTGAQLDTVLGWCRTGQLTTARLDGNSSHGEAWRIDRLELDERVLGLEHRPDGTVIRSSRPSPVAVGFGWTFAAAIVPLVIHQLKLDNSIPSTWFGIALVAYLSMPLWMAAIGMFIAWRDAKRGLDSGNLVGGLFAGSVVGLVAGMFLFVFIGSSQR